MSLTEKEAIESGDIWWEGDLFRGKPDWNKLHRFPAPQLTPSEQAFLDNETETFCALLDDWKIVHEYRDLPPEAWAFLKKNKFLGMNIDKRYGGLGFSAFAQSCIIAKIATRSLSAAVDTMVPNSLGPGELLFHYGSEEQKDYYLPRLACGEEIPCFALTSLHAGSDAGAMTDFGIIAKGTYQGKEITGIRLNWSKRYITLAPVSTLMGLAFKLYDPDHLLGEKTELGITVCLIPTDHLGVKIGKRHCPMGLAFMNGPISGQDVFIPLDWIIGGSKMIGQGWRMLMECLSMGRGISLPANSTAGAMLSYRLTSAYAKLRKQFKVPIGEFEGVQEALARIGGQTYIIEACRRMTASAVDQKIKPAVASAITKYHTTEMNRKIINDAMDIHGGRAIQLGPRNYIGHGYLGIPVGITVEGANILTRSLMIFGQGAIRCHPYVVEEMESVASNDIKRFDRALIGHIGFSLSNKIRTITYAFTRGRFIRTPVSPLAYYYRQLSYMSAALAITADFTMLMLGGSLKRKEFLSARLGDILSELYLASSVLKYFVDSGSPVEDILYVKWALKRSLFNIQFSFREFYRNLPQYWVGKVVQFFLFPFGLPYHKASDRLTKALAKSMMEDTPIRNRLTYLCCVNGKENPIKSVETAFMKLIQAEPIEKKIIKAVRSKQLLREKNWIKQIEAAEAASLITSEESFLLKEAEHEREESLAVDEFDPHYFK